MINPSRSPHFLTDSAGTQARNDGESPRRDVALPPVRSNQYRLLRYVISVSIHVYFPLIPHESISHSKGYEHEPSILRERASTGIALPQHVQQRLRLLEIGRVKALGEPAVHGCQQPVGCGPLALLLPQARQAYG